MIKHCILFCALYLTDYILTVVGMLQGMTELNPLMRTSYLAMLMFKIFIMALIFFLLSRVEQQKAINTLKLISAVTSMVIIWNFFLITQLSHAA